MAGSEKVEGVFELEPSVSLGGGVYACKLGLRGDMDGQSKIAVDVQPDSIMDMDSSRQKYCFIIVFNRILKDTCP